MYNFQTFGCSNESSPNSSCHFWNHKVRVYSNFASLSSVIKGNSSVFFYLKPHILWTKISHWSEIFGLLSGWVKIHEIPHVIFEITSLFSLNFASLFNVMGDESSVFFSWHFIWFLQKEPSTVQNFRLLTAQVKFHQMFALIGYYCWKYIKF